MYSGATQWRVECDPCGCSMQSEVSEANAEYFITEDRLADDLALDEDDLRERLQDAKDRGGNLLCCNRCGRLSVVNEDEDVDERAGSATLEEFGGVST